MSGETGTLSLPAFERLRYFHGQMLGARDFRAEQDYFREKIKLLTRCLDGYGIVCGFDVTPADRPDDCEPAEDERRRELEARLAQLTERQHDLEARRSGADGQEAEDIDRQLESIAADIETTRRELEAAASASVSARGPGGGGGGGDRRTPKSRSPLLTIAPGMAVDCAGNVLLLGAPVDIDPRTLLDGPDARRVERGEAVELHLSVCYCEQGIEPTRPVVSHSCATAESCEHARIRESITFRVTADPPPADERCDACCTPCDDQCGGGCLLLATIDLGRVPDGGDHGDPDGSGGYGDRRQVVAPSAIHNEVRRMLSRHRPTTIAAVNWWHGADYGVSAASGLARDGFVFELSDRIRTDTLRPGVIDVIVHQGGKGNVGGIYYVTGGIEVPTGEWADRIVWRSSSDETFQNGDRVLIILRGDFVLDRCCRPVDAENTGGRVPPSADAVEPLDAVPIDTCTSPPDRSGPWRSGNGTPGGVFESWLYVTTDAGETRS
ncbi:MAG: hypothetical protein WBM50_28215 [Acidimicrobiales bacterium]